MVKIVVFVAVGTLFGALGYLFPETDAVSIAVMPEGVSTDTAIESDLTPMMPAPAPGAMSKPVAEPDRGAQNYGTVCATSKGECIYPQAPINSFCTCNGEPGRIIR